MVRLPWVGSTARHKGHLMKRPWLVGFAEHRMEISQEWQIWCGVFEPHAMVYMSSFSSKQIGQFMLQCQGFTDKDEKSFQFLINPLKKNGFPLFFCILYFLFYFFANFFSNKKSRSVYLWCRRIRFIEVRLDTIAS
jgi:hypothetical protein